jgi:hypothetical protein
MTFRNDTIEKTGSQTLGCADVTDVVFRRTTYCLGLLIQDSRGPTEHALLHSTSIVHLSGKF